MKMYGVCFLPLMLLVLLAGGWRSYATAAPSPRSDDLLKKLQNLEQMYSSMARPRFGKRYDMLMNGILTAPSSINEQQMSDDYDEQQQQQQQQLLLDDNNEDHIKHNLQQYGRGGGGGGGVRQNPSIQSYRSQVHSKWNE